MRAETFETSGTALTSPEMTPKSERSLDVHHGAPQSSPPTSSAPNRQASGWDGDQDPENPYNWPLWRTNMNAGLLAMLAFLSPFSSAVMAPATPAILAEFGVENDLLEAFVVSSYVLAVSLISVPDCYSAVQSLEDCH